MGLLEYKSRLSMPKFSGYHAVYEYYEIQFKIQFS